MIDKSKIDQMLASLQSYANALARLAQTPKDEFLRNTDKIGNAKYQFVISIETCIDIANHIIASENLRFPKSNADSFAVLIEFGFLNEDLRENLRQMAAFRNRLVHLYWDVDDEKIFEYLADSLKDFARFAEGIAEAVSRKGA